MNRVYPGKTDTFIIDFVNKHNDIKKAFQPFYEETYLEGSTTYNNVYIFRNKLRKFMLYNDEEVDNFVKIKIKEGKKQDEKALGRVTSILKPIIDLYLELSEKKQYEFRDLLKV